MESLCGLPSCPPIFTGESKTLCVGNELSMRVSPSSSVVFTPNSPPGPKRTIYNDSLVCVISGVHIHFDEWVMDPYCEVLPKDEIMYYACLGDGSTVWMDHRQNVASERGDLWWRGNLQHLLEGYNLPDGFSDCLRYTCPTTSRS